MAKFLSNINLETANDIQFKTTAGANAGKISQTGDDLVISNAVGDILLGNGSDDVFIGDGTNTVDIRFEQDMAIFADSSSTRTLTLGGANTDLVLESPSISGTMTLGATTINNKLTFTGATGYILFDYEPTTNSGEYTNEVPLLKVDRSGSELSILSRMSNNGGLVLGIDDTTAIIAGDVKTNVKSGWNYAAENVILAAEGGYYAFGWPNNMQDGSGTQYGVDFSEWSDRYEFRFRTDAYQVGNSTTETIDYSKANNGLYIGSNGSTQFIDMNRNLKNIGTINSTGDVTITNGNVIFSSQYGARFNDANTRIYTNTDSPEDLIIEADQDLLITPDGQVRITGDADISGNLALGSYTVASQGNQTVFGKLSSFQNSGSTNLMLGVKNGSYPNRGWSFDPVLTGVNCNLIIKEHGSTAERIKISTGGNFEVLTGSVTATGLDINGNADISGNLTLSGGDLTGGNKMLSSFFLPQNPEGSHVKAPWFFNDMAYARLRGATVTVTVNGGSSPGNSDIDAMFDASTGFWNMSTSGVTSVVIEMTDPPKTMNYGAHYGVTFGNSHWRANSVDIDTYYSGAYQEVVSTTTNSKEFVYGALNSSNNSVSKIKWTFSDFNTTSMRIVSLFAYNYNATGMPSLYLAKDGGDMYGAIAMNSNNITGGGTITGTTLTGTSLDINGDADISGTLTTATWNGAVIDSAYLDSDTAHLSGSQTFTGQKTFQGNLILDDDAGDTPILKFINGSDNTYNQHVTSGGNLQITRTNNGGADVVLTGHATDHTLSTLQIGGSSTFGTNVTIAGNLTVNGTTVTVDTTNLNVQDKNITLNYSTGDSSSSAGGAGITIQDAVNSSTDATILWDATNDEFDFSHAVNVTGNITTSGILTAATISATDYGLTASDIPNLSAGKITSGTLQEARGGTGLTSISTLLNSNVDHDELTNFVAAEHYRWDTNISSTATIHASNIPTLNQNTSGSAASLSDLSLGDVVYGSESGYAKLSGNTQSNNKFLRSKGAANTATEPEWAQVGYNDLTGTVPTWNQNTTGAAATLSSTLAVNRGGTGATSLDAAGIVEKTGSQTIGGTKTFTGSIVLNDDSGASPTMRFMNTTTPTEDEVSIFCNNAGKMKFQQKLASVGSNVVQMTMDQNGLHIDNGLKVGTGVTITEIEDNDSLGTSDTKLCTQGNVKAYVDANVTSGGMTSWSLDSDANSAGTITNGTTVSFDGGTGITTTRSGSTITITNSAPFSGDVFDNDGTFASLRAQGTTKGDVGLGSAENKSSATIRGEITSSNVTTALGFTPTANTGTTTAGNTQTFTNKSGSNAGYLTAVPNDSVGLAQLASGTDGELITYDASGNPAHVAVGTAGHVLTSNGTGAAPTFQAATGQTYSVSVPSSTTKLRLTASGGTTDDIEFTGGTDISVTRVNGSELSIAYTGAGGYTLPAATSSALGGIKTGFTTNAGNRNYAVQLSSQKAYVNVPWTDSGNTMGNGFIVEDGDGDTVTITEGKYLKFKEGSGNGININFTDVSTGSSTDEYDLDFNLNIAGLANDLATNLFNHDSYIAITDSEDSDTTHKMLVGDMVDALAGNGLMSNGGTGNGVVAINVGEGNGISVSQDGIEVVAHNNITVSGNGVAVSNDIFNTNLRIGRGGTGMYQDYTTASDAMTIRTDYANSAAIKFEFTNGGIFRSLGTQVLNYLGWSDKRLKKNIKNLNYGLDAIMKLRPVSYDWKKEVDADKTNDLGFIAQEVEKVIPELVTESKTIFDDKKAKGVDYVKMVAVLTKAIQEQQKQIDELKELINGNS